jgi:hypothetical protein
VQDKLGAVCDAVVAVGRLRDWITECKDRIIAQELRATLRREQQELARRKQSFARWWTVRRREKMRRAWKRALERT